MDWPLAAVLIAAIGAVMVVITTWLAARTKGD